MRFDVVAVVDEEDDEFSLRHARETCSMARNHFTEDEWAVTNLLRQGKTFSLTEAQLGRLTLTLTEVLGRVKKKLRVANTTQDGPSQPGSTEGWLEEYVGHERRLGMAVRWLTDTLKSLRRRQRLLRDTLEGGKS